MMVSPRTVQVQRADTGFGGDLPDAYADNEEDLMNRNEPASNLQMFIRSMSRCIGQIDFGLSFQFIDLAFHPKKANKPILSGVTGRIDRGTLSGVMGASGAGKTTFVNVLMGKTKHTGVQLKSMESRGISPTIRRSPATFLKTTSFCPSSQSGRTLCTWLGYGFLQIGQMQRLTATSTSCCRVFSWLMSRTLWLVARLLQSSQEAKESE